MSMMKLTTCKTSVTVLVLIAITVVLSARLEAFERRGFSRIGPAVYTGQPGAPSSQELNLNLPPVSREAINKAVYDFFNAWNAGTVDTLLAPEFVNKDRLLDTIEGTVPRDAKIRVLGIGSVAAFPNDVIQELPGGQGFDRISTVTATVRTQIEFNLNGFQTIEGISVYTFKVIEEYR
jgi:hypothetical protein